MGRIQVVRDGPAVVDAQGQHGGVLAGAGVVQGRGFQARFDQGLGRGPVQGRMDAALEGVRRQPQPGQDLGGQFHLEVLAGQRPGKQGQLLRPEPEGRGGAGGEDGQGLKGLGQGAHADPGLGVAQAVAQVAGGIHHRDVAPVATLHPGTAGYFD